MPMIRVQHVVSCSSEDKNHKADNLLKDETYRKWKSASQAERSISVILQFEKASVIHSIDIGNEGAAFIEVLVGKSTDVSDNYQVLLVSSSFMSPAESKNNTNVNRVRMFGPEKLSKSVCNQKWDRVKIVCTQPFIKTTTYGLSFVKFHSPPSSDEPSEPAKTQGTMKLGAFTLKEESPSKITPGSLFKAEKKSDTTPLKGAAAVRAAATAAATLSTSTASPVPSTLQSLPQTSRTESRKRLSTEDDKTKAQPAAKRRHSNDNDSNVASSSKMESKTSTKRLAKKQEMHVPSLKKAKSEPSEKRKFSELMKGVVFCISGYQNPERSQLRDKAVDMGAKYRSDWTGDCTHLICAFVNTPKYMQVKKKGGKIVSNKWILHCYKKETLLPWKNYRLAPGSSSSEEESDDDTDPEYVPTTKTPEKQQQRQSTPKKQDKPTRQKTPQKQSSVTAESTREKRNEDRKEKPKSQKKAPDSTSGSDTEDEIERIKQQQQRPKGVKAEEDDLYGGSTDEEPVECNNKSTDVSDIPELPNFFDNCCFFFYGSFPDKERRLLTRYIIAYNGKIEEYMCDKVQYVVSHSRWDDNFNQALSDNCELKFVTPKWIYDCYDLQKRQPYQAYAIVP